MGRSGGGGRSSGGSSGRSSGGRSSSSYSSNRSSSSSSRSSGSSFNRGSNRGYSSHSHHYYGGGFGGYRRRSGNGCLTIIASIIILFAIALVLFPYVSDDISQPITKSTIAREALPRGSVNETDYYTDTVDWISNSTKLQAGMKNFYQQTGVQPYLYITDNLDGDYRPTGEKADAWMNSFYDANFTDEAHTLLVFLEHNSQYHMWYLNGKQAKTVLDSEAMDILMDYVERYYYSNMNEDEMFSTAYDSAGTRIMEITKEPFPWYGYVLIIALVVVFFTIFVKFWKAKKTQKNIEDENTAKILNSPIETMKNSNLEDLASKYEE